MQHAFGAVLLGMVGPHVADCGVVGSRRRGRCSRAAKEKQRLEAVTAELNQKEAQLDDTTQAAEKKKQELTRTIVACLVQAADAISAARPGARRENLENYIKRLEQLESISTSFHGVEKAYAIQAGREVRVMVKPEQVSEDQMVILARDLAKKIEEEMEYPGQIKVHVLRETKVIEYAK